MSSITEPDHHPEYSFAAPRKQLFAFPQDVFSPMLQNPSSHAGLMKLYQTCKHFYAKRPILIADDVRFGYDDDDDNVETSTKIKLSHGYKDITRLQVHLWLTNRLRIKDSREQRLPKFFRSSIKELTVWDSDLQYDDFVFLASENNINSFCLYGNTYLWHSDESTVSMEEALQHLPNIKKIWYNFDETCTRESLIKLSEIKLNNKFKFFDLLIYDVDPTFDFNLFCEFVTKNCDANTEFWWHPCQSQNLKDALAKMNPKWKTEALEGLKRLFCEIEKQLIPI